MSILKFSFGVRSPARVSPAQHDFQAFAAILDCAGVAQTHFRLFWTAQAFGVAPAQQDFQAFSAILDCAGVAQTHFQLFWIAQAWPDARPADKLLFLTAQAGPRRTLGYFGLRRRRPDALSADKLLFWIAQA